jgi:uncharacterized protein (TIGR00255 family)
MAIQSMTGYGNCQIFSKGINVSTEVCSLNHRQFDCRFNLPDSFSMLENEFRKIIHGKISRGSVNCKIMFTQSSDFKSEAVYVDYNLAEAYLTSLKKAGKKLKLENNLKLESLLNLPGVVGIHSLEERINEICPVARRSLRRALSKLMECRKYDGREMAKEIRRCLNEIENSIGFLKKAAPDLVGKYRKNLFKKIKSAELNKKLDNARLIQEIAIFAERSDIVEELTRLKAHIQQFRKMLNSAEPTGKAMEFLLQEMVREINTVASKARDIQIAETVIGVKNYIESIRELVRNIE